MDVTIFPEIFLRKRCSFLDGLPTGRVAWALELECIAIFGREEPIGSPSDHVPGFMVRVCGAEPVSTVYLVIANETMPTTPAHFSTLTINLRHDADRWEQRRPLLIAQIAALRPDLIAMQEVSMRSPQAAQVRQGIEELTGEKYYLSQFNKVGQEGAREGLGFLTRRQPLGFHEALDLGPGGRVAHRILMEVGPGSPVEFYNTHLHHEPHHDEAVRLVQVRQVLAWMAASHHQTRVLMGDFNAVPGSSTIAAAGAEYASAHESYHGEEAEFTFPTPLVLDPREQAIRRTLDYVFFTPSGLRVVNAAVVLDRPSPDDDNLWPSDHCGVFAEFAKLP